MPRMSRKRKLYEECQMENAVLAVKQKRMKVGTAATEFNVPASTLWDKIKGTYEGKRPGPKTELSEEEEKGVVNYMLYMSRQGFPLTRAMCRCFIQEIVKQSGHKTRFNPVKGPSDGWFSRFLKRHPELAARKPEHLDRGRVSMSTQKTVDDFFCFLDATLQEYGIKNKPSQIFNCDETGFSGKEMPRAKVFGPRGGHVFRRKPTTSDHVTAHLCVSADGRFLPSMIIFKGSFPHRNFKDGVPDSWHFSHSESGYMDTLLFQQWFSKVFIPNCGRERPVCLIMDNHDSHISIPVIEEARANGIVIVGLPGHSTHILQPLDVKHAIDRTTPSSISEAFAVTGICPFNPSAVDQSQLIPASFDSEEEQNAEASTSTCPTCGLYLTNPLVSRGLVPQSLAKILVPPPVKPQPEKKRQRVVAEGRLISGADMLKQLKDKEEIEKKKKEDSERRKIEMDEKKKEKLKAEEQRKVRRQKLLEDRKEKKQRLEEEKKLKQKLREERKQQKQIEKEESKKQKVKRSVTAAEIIAASLYMCDTCGIHGEVDDEEKGIMWYGCDNEECGRWYHDNCVTIEEIVAVQESLRDGTEWFL